MSYIGQALLVPHLGGNVPYSKLVKSVFGSSLVGYWILGESAGATADNAGANDVAREGEMVEVDWKGHYIHIIDLFRAKWPGTAIYIVKPWRRTYNANCDILAGWIDDILALYPSGVYAGHDERDWLENGDDGATYTSDGTHYNDAGQAVCFNLWKTILGYS